MLGRAARRRARWRFRVGYLPEHPYLYDYLTPAEYLDYVGRLFGLPARAAARADPGAAGPRRARALRRPADAPLLEGHGAAGGPRPGPRQRPRAADPRRADVGPRPDRPAPRPRPHPRPSAGRARRCSSRPTSSRTPRRCATGWRCCGAGGCSRSARSASCCGSTSRTWRSSSRARRRHARASRRPRSGAGRRPAAPRGRGGRARPRWSRAVEAAGGRVLSVQPVRQTLEDYFFREMGARGAGGAGAWGEG